MKNLLFILLMIFALLNDNAKASQSLKAAEQSPKIVNGYEAAPRQFPHQALVMITTMTRGTFPCGGILISSLWTISASHCLYDAVTAQVLLGGVNTTSMPVVRQVREIIVPKTFNLTTLRDDITLLRFIRAVQFSPRVKAIQLPTRAESNETYDETILTVSGYGKTEDSEASTRLRYVNVQGITNEKCIESYGDIITPKLLCTHGYPNVTQGSCTGDSGGPLILENEGRSPTLVGMVSFVSGRGCTVGDPQGFTRVGSYLDYISNITGIAIRE